MHTKATLRLVAVKSALAAATERQLVHRRDAEHGLMTAAEAELPCHVLPLRTATNKLR